MCAAKKQEPEKNVLTWLRGLISWLFGAGRPVLIGLIVMGVFGGGIFLAWRKMRSRILDLPEYVVGPGQVEITPLPPWIHSDVLAETFRDPRLDGRLSIMDDDLIDRIKKVFEEHPWVARVTRVSKEHPGSTNVAIQVEMEYRRPVCMVEVPGGVLAVDAEGVVLPSNDFSPVEATRYPLLVGVDRGPTSPVGRRWIDAKVTGGAEIAAALGADWESMQLKRIIPLADDPATAPQQSGDNLRRSREPFFALSTRGGTQILWGYAPGANMLGELPVAEKIARLKRYRAQHDTLDDPRNTSKQLDIRQWNNGR